MNRENLTKLIAWHKENVVPFEMATYRSDQEGDSCHYYKDEPSSCGTVGCAAGWAPFVPGLEPVDEDFEGEEVFTGANVLSWPDYVRRIFDLELKEGAFLFDSNWKVEYNTQKDFVKRGEFLLASGDWIVKNWDKNYSAKSNWYGKCRALEKLNRLYTRLGSLSLVLTEADSNYEKECALRMESMIVNRIHNWYDWNEYHSNTEASK